MKIKMGLAILALVAGLSGAAQAQSGASCPIGAPTIVTTTTYALTNDDTCKAFIFTSILPATVTAPNANTVAPGFQAMFFSVTGGLTVTSSASTINKTTAGVVIGGGQAGLLYGDGSNYSWSIGGGFVSTPALSENAGVTLGRFPGTISANSPKVVVPNGLLQFTNPASFRSGGYPFAACADAPMAFGNANQQSASPDRPWLQILDENGGEWLIPLCRSSR